MTAPEPLVVPWRSRQVRVRHDDPLLAPYTDRGQTIMAAMQLASDADGLLRALQAAVGAWYRVRVREDQGAVTVGLWRRRRQPARRPLTGAGVRVASVAAEGGRRDL